MTDWSKLKVTDLKEECKSRDIALTGLKLKQQYIDKLEEYEAQRAEQGEEGEKGQAAETSRGRAPLAVNGNEGETSTTGNVEADGALRETPANDVEPTTTLSQNEIPASADATAPQNDEKRVDAHAEGEQQSALHAQSATEVADFEDIQSAGVRSDQGPDTAESRMESVSQSSAVESQQPVQKSPQANERVASPDHAKMSSPQPTQLKTEPNTLRASQVPVISIRDDQAHRRKRSATPDPSSEDVSRKRARLSAEPQEAKAETVKQEEKVGIKDEPSTSDDALKAHDKDASLPQDAAPMRPQSSVGSLKRSRTRSPSEERAIPPAIHPATSSLYISRLKRPIQPQVFRSHIISKAKSRSSDDSDVITSFYLDSIKTHAFVSFTSVSAASRVRMAMHGVRFPDEASREPLFVDYVPDDQVQSWIDQEMDSSFGRVGGGRRLFEVVYVDGESGIEAKFQETDASKPRPPLEPTRSSRMSFDKQQTNPVPGGVHPDRVAFVPRDQRPLPPPATFPKPNPDSGRGFKALDELFSSTTTKPKLYYKTVSSSVSDKRLDMVRDLRVDYDDMGRSGDEGMKRYSFERFKDREEWVDKGPEFGHGRRGQERMVGGGRGFGARGRGGSYRGRPQMDSWRGGSGR
jgi:hypothetical protein